MACPTKGTEALSSDMTTAQQAMLNFCNQQGLTTEQAGDSKYWWVNEATQSFICKTPCGEYYGTPGQVISQISTPFPWGTVALLGAAALGAWWLWRK